VSGSVTITGSAPTSSQPVESSVSTPGSGGFSAPTGGSACAWRSVLSGAWPGCAPSPPVAASFATSISTSGYAYIGVGDFGAHPAGFALDRIGLRRASRQQRRDGERRGGGASQRNGFSSIFNH
jgi:hypothetical protein